MRWKLKHSKKLTNRESEPTREEEEEREREREGGRERGREKERERERGDMITLFNFRRLQKHETDLLQQKKEYEEEIAKLK